MQHIRSCGLRMCLFILFCTFFLFFFTPWLWNSNYIHIILLKSWHEDRYTAFCFPSKVILTLYCLVFKHSCVVLSMIDWFVLFWGRGFQCEIAVLSDAQVQSNASLRRLQFLWATNRAKWLRSDVIVVPNDIVFVSLLTSHLIINMISTVWRESRLFVFFVFFWADGQTRDWIGHFNAFWLYGNWKQNISSEECLLFIDKRLLHFCIMTYFPPFSL